MLNEEMILNELRAIRTVLDSIQADEKKNMKIPEASKRLGIGQAKLRELCKKGIIPAMRLNGEKKPQYVIYIPGAMNILTKSRYLMDRPKRKRKTTVDLTK